jgi:hypothetical protein
MMPEGQGFNLIISIVVSAAAGVVLAASLTCTYTTISSSSYMHKSNVYIAARTQYDLLMQ